MIWHCQQITVFTVYFRNWILDRGHKSNEGTKKSVKSTEEALAMLFQGMQKRRVRKTNMNVASSRSHAICTIYLGIAHNIGEIRESVINLVDLAGSEGMRRTGNTGQAHTEGKNINESLSAVRRVIDAMKRAESYIPYRDSAVTKLLESESHLCIWYEATR